jgi:hypothetical protein
MDRSELGDRAQPVHWHIGGMEGDILANRAAEEKRILEDNPHLLTQRLAIQLARINAVVSNRATGRFAEAQQQMPQRAFPRSAGPHNRHLLPSFDHQGDVRKHRRRVGMVTEAQILEGDRP